MQSKHSTVNSEHLQEEVQIAEKCSNGDPSNTSSKILARRKLPAVNPSVSLFVIIYTFAAVLLSVDKIDLLLNIIFFTSVCNIFCTSTDHFNCLILFLFLILIDLGVKILDSNKH